MLSVGAGNTDSDQPGSAEPAGRALLLTGSGMLAGCVAALAKEGWRVVVPSRRHAPIPVPREAESAGRAVWVHVDWADPPGLLDGAGRALRGPADLLVTWLSAGSRHSITAAMAPLLRPGAPVVEVHDSPAVRATADGIDPALPEHPTQQVVLGYVDAGGRRRWLTNGEITDGVLDAMSRALAGHHPTLHQVGEPYPWTPG